MASEHRTEAGIDEGSPLEREGQILHAYGTIHCWIGNPPTQLGVLNRLVLNHLRS